MEPLFASTRTSRSPLMRKALVGSLLIASIAVGSVAVAAVNPLTAVSAAVTSPGHVKAAPLQQGLDELVANGTITQAQADAITANVKAKREARWADHPRLAKSLLVTVAQQLNMDPKDLVAELRTGKSIGDVAGEKGVEPQAVIDNLVGTL